jgi:hypothetical protein
MARFRNYRSLEISSQISLSAIQIDRGVVIIDIAFIQNINIERIPQECKQKS